MDYIKEKVKVCKSYINKTNKDIDNYIGLLIRAVRDDWKDNVVITSSFNDYEQRKYDGSDGGITTEELEKKLLFRQMSYKSNYRTPNFVFQFISSKKWVKKY